MSSKEIIDLSLQVVTDFRIVIIFVCIILYLNFVIYISRYRKASKKNKNRGRRRIAAVTLPDNAEVTIPDAEDED